MFIQACLIAVGIHFGRKFWDSLDEETAPEPEGRPAGNAAPAGREGTSSGSSQSALEVVVADEVSAPAVVVEAAGGAESHLAHHEEAAVDEQLRIAVAATGLTLAATLFMPSLRVFGGGAVLYGSIPIFKKAKRLILEEKRIGIEVLDSLGLLASSIARQYTISAIMFLTYAGAQKLRIKTERAARKSMLDVFGSKPDRVWTVEDGVEREVSLSSLKAGNIVVIGAGGSIPADGEVVSGAGMVDQRLLTGESALVEKTPGDQALAMTVVSSGRLYVRVERAGKETTAAQISAILQNTADFASSIELQSKKIADASALPILALSALAWPMVGPGGTVAMLNIGIADNMRVIAPFSMLNYLRKAYDSGILLKDGRSLQLLTSVDTVVFDKTGTLTENELHVCRIHTSAGVAEADVLIWAAALERRQAHPIAHAILGEAHLRGYAMPALEDASYEVGHGISGRIEGALIRVGSRRFLDSAGVSVPASLLEAEKRANGEGRTAVYVARDGQVAGLIEFEAVLRPEAEQVIAALKARNLSLYVLSGDSETPTRKVAERLGLDGYFAEVLPADKARIIGELQQQGKIVCFVGDGLNDAIALERATVSISMRGASAVAVDCAQVMLMEHGIARLPELFTIAFDFQNNMSAILLSALIPASVAAAGVFFAGYTTNAVAICYFTSMAAGLGISIWPHRNRAANPSAMVETH